MQRTDRARLVARSLLDAALGAADGRLCVRRALESRPELRKRIEFTPGRVIVVGFGKAVVPMVAGFTDAVDRRPDGGIVIAPHGAHADLGAIDLRFGGHPVPDEHGVAAALEMEALLQSLGPSDLVVALISGGGSSLGALPHEGVSLDEVVARTSELLSQGVPIREVNAERRRLTRFSGGGLARAAAPAATVALVLSDVPGDDLDVVASGPTVGFDGPPATENVLVGCNHTALSAAARFARSMCLHIVVDRELVGSAAEAGRRVASLLAEMPTGSVILRGGESTVAVRGAGHGGRNQELALAASIGIAGRDGVAVMAVGTDGIDGPTDAAGAIVDGGTVARLRARGIDPVRALEENDSATALEASGDRLILGPTGTNVADLVIGVVDSA